jgi:PAS domain S-box-containing protein
MLDPGRQNSGCLLAIAAVLAIFIFSIDALTPLDIAIAVMYVVVVLLCASSGSRRLTLIVGVGCILLTALGYELPRFGTFSAGALGRAFVSVLAIATTLWLSLRNLANTATLQEQVKLLELTHDAIVVYRLDGIITFWSRGARELYGHMSSQALGQPMHALLQTRFPTASADINQTLLQSDRWEGELEQSRRDGSSVTVSSRWSLWRDAKGKPLAVLATNNDITQRKHAENALARNEAFLAHAQQLSHTGSIGFRLPSGEMAWSVEAHRIFGYGLEAIPSMDLVLARVHADDVPLVMAAYEQALAGTPRIELEHRLTMPDGKHKQVHFVARSTRHAGQIEYVGALMDVTETRRTQEALHRSMTELAHVTRVTMLGELAASIAHEVSQPIAAIVTNGDAALRWLNRDVPDYGEAFEAIDGMIRNARRSSDVIDRVRALAQKRDPHYAMLSINAMVEESAELVSHELQTHHTVLAVELSAEEPLVRGDRVQLQQVIVNLLMNGVQAMASVIDRPRRLTVRTRLDDENAVFVAVQDSGTGISKEDATRLFSTFFTTKAEGMGMGLSICRSIVEAHGGTIGVVAQEGPGATFEFSLPPYQPDEEMERQP